MHACVSSQCSKYFPTRNTARAERNTKVVQLEAHDDQCGPILAVSYLSVFVSPGGVPASSGAMAATLLLSPTLHPAKSCELRCRSRHLQSPSTARPGRSYLRIHALQETKEEAATSSSPEEITEKYGLEFGLWKVQFFAHQQ